MNAMIAAELLRLRTVATHRWVALGLLALIAVNAAPFLNGAATTSDEVVAQLRGLAQLSIVWSPPTRRTSMATSSAAARSR